MGLADMLTGGANSGFSGGRDQIINGKTYQQYSPQWYAAMDADKTRRATATGTAIGTGTKAAYDAMGNPADTSSSSASGSGSGSLGGISANLPPHVGAGGSVGAVGSTGGGGSPISAIPQISKPDQSAAEAATFGAAKDKVGQTTAGALTGLRSALGGRGMLGSSAEYRGTASTINKGQGELGDVARQQAVTHLGNEMDIDKANLGASVTGRGQDISARGDDMSFALGSRGQDVQQRGQDIQYEESKATLAQTKSLQEAAQRQQILAGIMGAINGSTLY